MKWITRENVHVDRVACPWLITHFIDKEAEFVFVPRDTDPATITEGIVFDMKGVELGHHGNECSFVTILKKYHLDGDPALVKLGAVVNLADTGRMNEDPLAFALEALAQGYRLSSATDHETLAKEFFLYDALYAFFAQESGPRKPEPSSGQLMNRKRP